MVTVTILASVSLPAFSNYKYSGGCASVCFGECEDFSNRPNDPAKCPRMSAESPSLCKVLYGECARIENGTCGWKRNPEFDACLLNPKAYSEKFRAIQRVPSRQNLPSVCPENKAIAIARSNPAIARFCVQKVHGESHGCIFSARTFSPIYAEDKTPTSLAWVVKASIIHSYDAKGVPQFMPEGAVFADISKTCQLVETMGPLGSPLK